jgi:hypothetical protein
MTMMTSEQKRMFMIQIAGYLPDFEYCQPTPERTPRLAGPDGMAIYINTDNRQGKLHIHGEWPMDGTKYMSPRSWCVVVYDENQDVGINVGADRSPEVIAREITRRFLPAYLALYKKCMERKAEHDAYRNRAYKTACELATVAGLSFPQGGDDTQYSLHIGNVTTRGWYGSARCNADSVDLTLLSLSPEIAAQVLQLVYAATPSTEATAA